MLPSLAQLGGSTPAPTGTGFNVWHNTTINADPNSQPPGVPADGTFFGFAIGPVGRPVEVRVGTEDTHVVVVRGLMETARNAMAQLNVGTTAERMTKLGALQQQAPLLVPPNAQAADGLGIFVGNVGGEARYRKYQLSYRVAPWAEMITHDEAAAILAQVQPVIQAWDDRWIGGTCADAPPVPGWRDVYVLAALPMGAQFVYDS